MDSSPKDQRDEAKGRSPEPVQPMGKLKHGSSFDSVDEEGDDEGQSESEAFLLPRDGGASTGSAQGIDSSKEDLARLRKEKRLAMNRVSARNRRKRKKMLIETLEGQVATLKTANRQHHLANESLQAKVRQLENDLSVARATIRQLTTSAGASSTSTLQQQQQQSLMQSPPQPLPPQHQQPQQYGTTFTAAAAAGGGGNLGSNLTTAGLGKNPGATGATGIGSTNAASSVDFQRMEMAAAQNDWDRTMRQQAHLQQLARLQGGGGGGAGTSPRVSGAGMIRNSSGLGLSNSGMAGYGVSAGADEAILQQQILAAQAASRDRTFNSMISHHGVPYSSSGNTGMHPNPLLNTVRDNLLCFMDNMNKVETSSAGTMRTISFLCPRKTLSTRVYFVLYTYHSSLLNFSQLAGPRPTSDFGFTEHTRLESETARLPDALMAQPHQQSDSSLQFQQHVQASAQPQSFNDQQLIEELLRQHHQEQHRKSLG